MAGQVCFVCGLEGVGPHHRCAFVYPDVQRARDARLGRGRIEAVCCYGVENDRESWCRVGIARKGQDEPTLLDLSWAFALKYVPRLLERYGIVGQVPGLWHGTIVRV
jgi:hypothetical protein